MATFNLIFKAALTLSAQVSIDRVVKEKLIKALKNEKIKRKREKKLNLYSKDAFGAQFFSPTKILRAKELAAEKEAAIEQKKVDLAKEKALANARRAKKRLQTDLRKEEKSRVAAERRATKVAKSAAWQAKRAASKQAKITTKTAKKDAVNPIEIAHVEEVVEDRNQKRGGKGA